MASFRSKSRTSSADKRSLKDLLRIKSKSADSSSKDPQPVDAVGRQQRSATLSTLSTTSSISTVSSGSNVSSAVSSAAASIISVDSGMSAASDSSASTISPSTSRRASVHRSQSQSSASSTASAAKPKSFRRATMPTSKKGRRSYGYIPVVEQPTAQQYVIIEQTRVSGISLCPASSQGGTTPKTIVFAGNSRHYLAQVSRPKLPRRKEIPRAWTREDVPVVPPTFQLSRPGQSRFPGIDATQPIAIVDSAVSLGSPGDVPFPSSYSTATSSYTDDGFLDDGDVEAMAPGTHATAQRYALPEVDYLTQKLGTVQVSYTEARAVR